MAVGILQVDPIYFINPSPTANLENQPLFMLLLKYAFNRLH